MKRILNDLNEFKIAKRIVEERNSESEMKFMMELESKGNLFVEVEVKGLIF